MKKREIVKHYNEFIDKITEATIEINTFSPGLYGKYNVKKGLRNEDGSGVLVGLTEIGDVHGYIVDENEKVPVHGRLRYRGIDVKDIVSAHLEENRFGFEEVCYLILFGKLPNKQQLGEFNEMLGSQRKLPDGFLEDVILAFPSQDLMNMLGRYVLAMYSFDDEPDDLSVKNNIMQSVLLIATFPSFVSYGYQAKEYNYNNKTLHIRNPLPELSTAENILRLIRSDGQYSKEEARILDLFLVLHAEHGGGNNSAFATHVVSSSGTDIYSAITAAIGSLKGFRHGGANLKVMGMMEEIKAALAEGGYPAPVDLPQLLACVYHSLVDCYQKAIKNLEVLCDRKFTSINIVGGGSKNELLNQMTADATGLPVYAGPTEGTALGNLLIQMIVAGEFKDLAEARKVVRESFKIKKYEPKI